jgi:hypothetical protein
LQKNIDDGPEPYAVWIYKSKNDSCHLSFNRISITEGTIKYRIVHYFYYDEYPYYRYNITNGIFEINENM